MMGRFRGVISLEMGEAAVGGAVGVTHHEHALGLVQADRHADLLEDEVLLEIVARRGERFRAAGDDDHIRALDGLFLEELPHGSADALVETEEHGGVGDIGVGGRVEVEDFAHDGTCIILADSVGHGRGTLRS